MVVIAAAHSLKSLVAPIVAAHSGAPASWTGNTVFAAALTQAGYGNGHDHEPRLSPLHLQDAGNLRPRCLPPWRGRFFPSLGDLMRPQDFHPEGGARYTVPLPPSTNGLYANARRGRVKTLGYLSWINEAGWEIKSQHPFLIPGQISVEYVCPIRSKADLGNLEKPLSDLLVRMGVIEDDKHITKIKLMWARDIEKVQITVRPNLI